MFDVNLICYYNKILRWKSEIYFKIQRKDLKV